MDVAWIIPRINRHDVTTVDRKQRRRFNFPQQMFSRQLPLNLIMLSGEQARLTLLSARE